MDMPQLSLLDPPPAPHLWAEAGVEPSLGDLVQDPLVHAILARDALTTQDLCSVIRQAKADLGLLHAHQRQGMDHKLSA